MAISRPWHPATVSLPRSDRTRGRYRAVVGTVLATVGLLAGATASAGAATTVLHAAPAAAGTADCATPASACTISAAVAAANASPTTDEVRIRLLGGTYPLAAPTPTALEITFAGPRLTLEADGGTPTLDGGGATRVLSVGATSHVTVRGLAFRAGGTAERGGAIKNLGDLSVAGATFSGNTAGNGGAISNEAAATLAVADTTFADNTTTGVGGGALIDLGTATVVRSTFVGNTAPINGGAINVQPGATTTVTGATFQGNTSRSLGGAFANLGRLTVQASTIAGNSASQGSVIATGNANATFAAVLVAAQTSGDACSPAGSAIVDAGYNLDTDGTCVSATTPATGSHGGATAYGSTTYAAAIAAYLEDDLADHGGPTRTLALLRAPDPATDAANPAFPVVPPAFDLPVAVGGETKACAVADQRGVRPAAGAACAIGAYQLVTTSTTLASSADAVLVGAPVTYTASVSPAPAGATVAFDDGAGNPATTQCAVRPVSDGTATCTVSYPTPGDRAVTASYDGGGTPDGHVPSTSPARTTAVTTPPAAPPASTATPPGGAPPASTTPATAPVPPAPRLGLSNLGVTRCVGTTARAQRRVTGRYALSTRARVTYTLQRRVDRGTPGPTRCPAARPDGAPGTAGDYATVRAPSSPAGGRAAATRAPRTRALTRTVDVGKGVRRFGLGSLLGATTLRPGRYRVLVQAVDATGAKAQEAVYLWVLRPRSR